VQWTSLVNASASGNTVTKTAGCGGCPDASAASVQSIASNGGVEFTASGGGLRYVGLNSGNSGGDANGIRFALRLQGSVAEVRENGVWKSETQVSSGDVLRISVENGAVKYARNGAVFYTSGSSASSSMIVNAALLDAGASVNNAMITSGSQASSAAPPTSASAPAAIPTGYAVPRSPVGGRSQTGTTPRRSPHSGGQ
jgi:hypothetical protein